MNAPTQPPEREADDSDSDQSSDGQGADAEPYFNGAEAEIDATCRGTTSGARPPWRLGRSPGSYS